MGLTILDDILKKYSKYSEKRVYRMVILATMLTITVIDACKHGLNEVILVAWMGYAGYEGNTIYKEKKLNIKPSKDEVQ